MKSWQQSHIKKNLYYCTLLFIILVGFALRLIGFPTHYLVDHQDTGREYLVAKHIITQQEYPLIGPPNSMIGEVRNSTPYFYIITFPLLLYNSIYTLAVVNVVLKLIVVILLWFLARILYGPAVAILSTFFVVFNQNFMGTTDMFWQPTLAEAILTAAFMCLAWGFTKKSYTSTTTGALLYTYALGIGHYAIPIAPIVFGVVYINLIRARASSIQIKSLIIKVVILASLVYAPIAAYMLATKPSVQEISSGLFVSSFLEWSNQIFAVITRYWRTIINGQNLPPFLVMSATTMLLCTTCIYFFSLRPKTIKYSTMILAAVAASILAASILARSFFHHHFVAIFGISLILLTEIAIASWNRTMYGKILTILSVGAIATLTLLYPWQWNWWTHRPNVQMRLNGAVEALASDIATQHVISASGQLDFQIVTFEHPHGKFDGTYTFLTPLEEQLRVSLAHAPKETHYVITPKATSQNTIYLICLDYEQLPNVDCLSQYHALYPRYIHTQQIYQKDRYTIYRTTPASTHTPNEE